MLLLLLVFSYLKGGFASASGADGTADGVAFDDLSQDTGKEGKPGQCACCPNFLQQHGELSHSIKTGISVLAIIVSIFLIVTIIILLQRSDADSWWMTFLVVLVVLLLLEALVVTVRFTRKKIKERVFYFEFRRW